MSEQLLVVLPELTLVVMAVVVLLIDVFSESEDSTRQSTFLGLVSVLVSIGVCLLLAGQTRSGFAGAVRLDAFGMYLSILALATTGAAIVMSSEAHREMGGRHGEYVVLLLLSTVGALVMVKATELMSIFIGLETLSIPLYVLAGYRKRDPLSTESSLKYFLMGAVASAFLLYGIALTFASLGSTHLEAIANALRRGDLKDNGLLLAAIGFMLVGFGFKLALVPFHMWAPDVYEGSPTPVTAFMAAAVKVAAVGALMRLLASGFLYIDTVRAPVLWTLAAVSIAFGNILAVTQDNLKRMLAYSSIAHVGYIMIGLVALQRGQVDFGAWSVLFYLAAYAVVTMGSFGVLVLVQSRPTGAERIRDLAGLGRRHPLVALCMTIFLLSLGGVPPLWGFVAKFYVFGTAVEHGNLFALVIIAILGSLLSIFYYLRVIVEMYMSPDDAPEAPLSPSLGLRALVGTAAILTVLGGVFPSWLAEHARRAFASLLSF